MSAVFVTRGGKYHTDAACIRMVLGEELWGFDGEGWNHTPGNYRRQYLSAHYAAVMVGASPCLACVSPADRYLPLSPNFGHQPFEYDGVPICARCCESVTHYDEAYRPSRWTRPVPWPCTSAVVLGLVPREEES